MSGVVTTTILSNGKRMSPEYNLMSIDIIKEVNKIPMAQLILLDGSASEQEFAISNTDFFKPGSEIEIKLKYEWEAQNEATVFKGIIIRHSVRADRYSSYLSIDLKDAAIKLTRQRRNAVFRDMADSKIIKKIIDSNKTNIEVGDIVNTKVEHQEMVQFYCTDWDFILSRADVNGCWIIADDGQINLVKPKLNKQIKRTFEYGISDIYELEMDADISHQYTSVESIAWDIKTPEMLPPQQAAEFSLEQSNLDPGELAKRLSADSYQLITLAALEDLEIQAWADAKLIKSRLSMLQGRLKIPGVADIKLGDAIDILGIGTKFNGKTLVTAIRHQVNEQGWQTDVQFGLSANWFTQQNNDIVAPPAAGLIPAINGLQIGIVDEYREDPDKHFRVRVKIPSIEQDGVIWARLAAIDAGKERGILFRPEVGDEVVLGFINDDPRQAVILGAMHSEKNFLPPDFGIGRENNQKGIVTKENLKILFDDEAKSIEISTHNGNKLELSDTDKGINLIDENGNTIIMNESGLQIKSSKDIKIEGKNITIKGSKVDIN